MKRYKNAIIALGMFMGVVTPIASPAQAQQGLIADDVCSGNTSSIICKKKATGEQEVKSTVKTVINSLLFVVGIIAIVMIIIGGIRYATSNGDPGSITGAKNTILYSIVGLAIAIFSYAIVEFVNAELAKPGQNSTTSQTNGGQPTP